MRPQIRPGIRCVPLSDGALLHGDHGTCTLKGAQAAEWLSRLTPHLTGERTLDQLVHGLPSEHRAHVVRLVGALAEEGFVLDAAEEEPHGLTEGDLDAYAAEIAFIRYRLPSAERRFERLRQARIALTGHGPVLLALLESGLACGWLQVIVDAPVGETGALAAAVERARRDGGQRVCFGEAALTAEGADVVLQVADDRANLLATAEVLRGLDVSLGQILVNREEAWIHPVAPAEAAHWCWRRLGSVPQPDGCKPEVASTPDLLTGAVPGLLGARLALSCFSHLTGLAPPEERPTRIDLLTLDSSRHRVMPLEAEPSRFDDGDVRSMVEKLASADPIGPDELLERTTACVDPRTGLFGRLDEDALPQMPLTLCTGEVRPTDGPPARVIGWAADLTTARVRTVLAACAAYGALTARAGIGFEIHTGRTRHVAAPKYPAGLPLHGYGAGLTWDGAVGAALRSRAEEVVAGMLSEWQGRPVSLRPGDLDDPESASLLNLLKAAGDIPSVIDLGEVLGLPAYLVRTSGPDIVSCGDTEVTALRDGLERTVLAWQVRSAGLPEHAAAPRPWWSGDGRPRWRAIAEALEAVGRTPVVIPLACESAPTPFTVRVELCVD